MAYAGTALIEDAIAQCALPSGRIKHNHVPAGRFRERGGYLPLASGDSRGADYCLEHAKNLIGPLPEAVHKTAKEVE